MDRRQLNLAGRILDPMGPLLRLLQFALSAQAENTGTILRMLLNHLKAPHRLSATLNCALVDRRKGLLAKVSPESLDLVDDSELFVPGTTELFGKKFKKAIFKSLKLAKEMDSLLSASRYGNRGKQRFQPFR